MWQLLLIPSSKELTQRKKRTTNLSKVEKRILMKEAKLLKMEFFLDNLENTDY